jgi:two-component system, LytTR family, response regulator
MEKIRVIIVDDEKPARSRLGQCLSREADVEVVGVARDGVEAVKLLRAHKPDLLFLDVQMPSLDGFGVLREIGPDGAPLVVFVTAYDKYAIKAFETHAVDYLLKPYSDQRFEAALQQARRYLRSDHGKEHSTKVKALLEQRAGVNQRSGYLERVALKSNGRIVFLNVDEVDWIEAAGVYIHLHVGGKTHIFRSSVVHMLDRLDPARFVRVHRSTVVNTARIRELQPRSHGDYTVVLHDGTELMMSRAYRSELETWLRQSL